MASESTITKWTSEISSESLALGNTNDFSPSWVSSLFGARKSDSVLRREATDLSDDAKVNAYKNVRGGTSPTFDKTNLYGFSIFKFSNTFGNGFNTANIGSLLGGGVLGGLGGGSSFLGGGDNITNADSYFFNVNPMSITLSEPFTTNITPTQNSGFYVESQGVQIRTLSISGTTGYRPNIDLLPKNADGQVPLTPGEETGFVNFVKLRNVFRNYSDLKKDPKAAYSTFLVWYNGLTQEAWFCEPVSFEANASANSPFTYSYSFSVVLLKKMSFSAYITTLNPWTFDKNFLLESMRLGGLALRRENLPEWLAIGAGALNSTLDTINELSSLVNTVNDLAAKAVQGVAGAAIGSFLYTGAEAARKSADLVFNSQSLLINLSSATEDILSGSPDLNLAFEEFGIDMQTLGIRLNRLLSSAVRLAAEESPGIESRLGKNNSRYNTINSGISSSSTSNTAVTSKTIPQGVRDVFAWLQQYGVTEDLFEVFKELNNLKFPYFSNIPQPSLAYPGAQVLVPIPAKTTPQNIETILLPFNMKKPLYEEILGRDLKLSSVQYDQGHEGFVFDLTDTGDLALVDGSNNIKQAISIKINVPKGDLPMHPSFGRVETVGMRATRNLFFASYLAYNDTMLSDGRIESISNMKMDITGDVLNVSFVANVIGDFPNIPVGISTGV